MNVHLVNTCCWQDVLLALCFCVITQVGGLGASGVTFFKLTAAKFGGILGTGFGKKKKKIDALVTCGVYGILFFCCC